MAILKRQKPKKTHHKIRDALWPRMGWRRTLRYTKYRLIRLQDSERNIAVGLSWGAAISFTPFMGGHILLAALFTWMMRGNVIAGAIGTVWGNPWTLPLMQLASFETGKLFFRFFGIVEFSALPENLSLKKMFDYIIEHPYDLVIPWVAGGVVLTFATWPLFYMLHMAILEGARSSQRATREESQKARKAAGGSGLETSPEPPVPFLKEKAIDS